MLMWSWAGTNWSRFDFTFSCWGWPCLCWWIDFLWCDNVTGSEGKYSRRKGRTLVCLTRCFVSRWTGKNEFTLKKQFFHYLVVATCCSTSWWIYMVFVGTTSYWNNILCWAILLFCHVSLFGKKPMILLFYLLD